ncbi:energy-coupling factor ABC transporter ATP-binding protein [Acetomicrobium hydrogeniformans]|uniref:ABC transporter, ATP-binding protein n=1 Tax=Acetomicrobium hydrogeniformans ATCC BAA-1850 TaxID=592015 RepID=A0A0T5X8K7_9BACT|nr:ABC transporter ATP-binding protein [Acetomicrobium hydrogeniformans]KRT34673.1 ABC transporter, ATP-binding protein [Acetomicrobium hydrogeniformans ATCC BAA-1850]
MKPLLVVKDLTFAYPGKPPIFSGLNFEIYTKEKVCIIGKNGAGKTTFFYAIMGLLGQLQGEIIFEGKSIRTKEDLRYLRQKVGFLFQDPEDQLFCPTLLDDVLFGPLNMGLSRKEATDRAWGVLKELKIEDLAHNPPYTLSGGQKRLGALAAILAMDPQLLLLDEPSSGLDEEAASNLSGILTHLDKTIIMASHDMDFAEEVASSWYELSSGILRPLHGKTRVCI